MKDLISVIVPIYNTSKYLERCIDSVVNQTYSHLEIILVNDGSNDDSMNICYDWKKRDSRIVVIDKPNGGLVSARKEGLRAARGNLIGFVDSDDYIDSSMYMTLLENKKKTQADFVYCGLHNCYENEYGIEMSCDNEPKLYGEFQLKNKGIDFLKRHIFTLDIEKQAYTGGICLGIYDKQFILQAYAIVPERCSQGEDFICQNWMIMHANKVVFLEDVLYHYCIHWNSISQETGWKKKQQINYMTEVIKEIANEAGILADIGETVDEYRKLLLILDEIRMGKGNGIGLYLFSKEQELENKRVIIYAAGIVGKSYREQFENNQRIAIVGQIDKYRKGERIKTIDFIKSIQFDYIVIALERKSTAQKVISELIELGVSKQKILWEKPQINRSFVEKWEK